jgi:adenylate cyclase
MSEDLSDLAAGLEGAERAARLALIEGLRERGCTAGEIREAHERGRLALLPLELALRDEGSRSLEDIAAAHGVDPEALVVTRRALGLPVEREAPLYGRAVDGQARRLRTALDAGIPLEELVTINRVIGRAMATIASAARDAMETLLVQTDVDESVRALRAAEAAEALIPDFEQVLAYAFGEHVRELVRLEAGTRLARAGEPDVRHVGIAFADLVDFTRLGDRLAPNELGEVAERLETLAFEALRPGVSVVKTIGDEVMLASPDLPALVATVLDLVSAAESPGFPRLRAGAAAGPARHRAGDWYGRTVNLASRLTALAEPGTLSADPAIVAATAEVGWTPAGEREVRGFAAPVAISRAAPRPATPRSRGHGTRSAP